MLYVPDWALTSLVSARAFLGLEDDTRDDDVAALIRSQSARIEKYCTRKLKSRAYQDATNTVKTGCIVTNGSKRVTHATVNFTATPGAQMSGTGIAPGTALVGVSVGGPYYADLSKPAIADGSLVPLTFSTPDSRLVHDGSGRGRLMLSEYPLTTLTSAIYYDAAGVSTTIDLTGAIVARDTAIIQLLNDGFPKGKGNLRISATCGYLDGDDMAELAELERVCLALMVNEWQDQANLTGRTASLKTQAGTVTFDDSEMPKRYAARLAPFVRQAW